MIGSLIPPAIHPGEFLADEFDELGITDSQAARELGIPQSRVSNILRKRTGISADTAIRLGQWLGTGPEIWLNMQKTFELRLAEQSGGDTIRAQVTRHVNQTA